MSMARSLWIGIAVVGGGLLLYLLVSNGSAVNALANKPPMWHEQGVPVSFFVGDPAQRFGEDLPRLQTPAYRDGYLPIVTIAYESDGITYYEEAFAPVDAASADPLK